MLAVVVSELSAPGANADWSTMTTGSEPSLRLLGINCQTLLLPERNHYWLEKISDSETMGVIRTELIGAIRTEGANAIPLLSCPCTLLSPLLLVSLSSPHPFSTHPASSSHCPLFLCPSSPTYLVQSAHFSLSTCMSKFNPFPSLLVSPSSFIHPPYTYLLQPLNQQNTKQSSQELRVFIE